MSSRPRREDIGTKASRLSRAISPEQVAELMAIKWFSIGSDKTRTPTAGCHWTGDGIYPPLLALGLIRGDRFPGGWGDPKARIARLTKLGELTIHFLAERVMVAAGVMAGDDEDEEAKPGGYPADINNSDDWAAFLARYTDNRVTNQVHNGIGLVALHIVDAIRGARESGQ